MEEFAHERHEIDEKFVDCKSLLIAFFFVSFRVFRGQ